MIPILYETSETSFTSNGLGRLTDIIEATVTEERNGIYELDFTYPVDGRHFDDIQLGRIIAVTHDDSGDTQPFDIVSYSKPIDGVVSFHAVHISYRLREYVVEGVFASIFGIQNAFNKIKTTAYPPDMPFYFETDINNTTSYFGAAGDGVFHSARQMLGGVEGSILDAFGGEYEFDHFRVFLHSARGIRRDFTIRYGVNLTAYTDDTDYSETFNTAIGFWKGQSEDGEDVIIESSPVTVGSTYTGRNICAAIDLTSKFEAQPTGVQLTEAARNYMIANQTTIPKQTIKVDFIRLQDFEEFEEFEDLLQCNLCDRINVVFPRYNMSGEYKIVRVVWDVVAERYKEMELGELSTTLSEALGIVSNDRNEQITNFAVAGSLKAGALYIDGDAQIDGDAYIDGSLSVGGSPVADFIVEQGTSGKWKYRKWNSGVSECWCRIGPETATNGLYYESFPSGLFANTPFVWANIWYGAGDHRAARSLVISDGSSSELLVLYFRVSNTATEYGTKLDSSYVFVNVMAKGIWK